MRYPPLFECFLGLPAFCERCNSFFFGGKKFRLPLFSCCKKAFLDKKLKILLFLCRGLLTGYGHALNYFCILGKYVKNVLWRRFWFFKIFSFLLIKLRYITMLQTKILTFFCRGLLTGYGHALFFFCILRKYVKSVLRRRF